MMILNHIFDLLQLLTWILYRINHKVMKLRNIHFNKNLTENGVIVKSIKYAGREFPISYHKENNS